MSTAKDEAINLITRLPDEVSWDDIMYEMYVKTKSLSWESRQPTKAASFHTRK